MLLSITHTTQYRYAQPVHYSIQRLLLTPRVENGQRVRQWQINAPGQITASRDAFDNVVHWLTLENAHSQNLITVQGKVETGLPTADWPQESLPVKCMLQDTSLTKADEALRQLTRECVAADAPLADNLQRLMASVEEKVRYQSGVTDTATSAAKALSQGMGVCQDHSHILVTCARLAGWPARYVSGYLFTGDEGHLASHAWSDVWDEKNGMWLSCDATHQRFTDDNYCRLAVGRDFLDASPVRGVRRGGGIEELKAEVMVSQTQS